MCVCVEMLKGGCNKTKFCEFIYEFLNSYEILVVLRGLILVNDTSNTADASEIQWLH